MNFTLTHIWASMGLVAKGVVFVLLAMSVIALSIAVERVFTLLLPRARGRRFAEKAQVDLEKGEFERVLDAGPDGDSATRRVVSTGVRQYLGAKGKAPSSAAVVESVEGALDRAIDGEGQRLRRGLGALATIGSTAPFVGLFGTVVGIVNAFADMARHGAGRLEVVSAGISEALVTTALGILVAVPAVALFNYFSGAADATEATLANAASVLVEFVRKATWTSSNGSKE